MRDSLQFSPTPNNNRKIPEYTESNDNYSLHTRDELTQQKKKKQQTETYTYLKMIAISRVQMPIITIYSPMPLVEEATKTEKNRMFERKEFCNIIMKYVDIWC